MDAMGLLMVQKSCDHQLMLVVHPIIYDVFYIPGGDGRIYEPSTVSMAQLGSLLWSSRSWWIFFWYDFAMVLSFFGTSLIWKWWIVVFIEDYNWIGNMEHWKKNIFKCWRAMVFYGKLVKQNHLKENQGHCTLHSTPRPPKNRQPTGKSMWPFWDS